MDVTEPVPRARPALWEPLAVAVAVTVLVGACSMFLPDAYASTGIAALFLFATWLFVWRKADSEVVLHGLSLGGLILPKTPLPETLRRALSACGYALVTSLVVFGPFFIGFRIYWQRLGFLSPDAHFHVPWTPRAFGSDVAAQLLMVALPEEAFYRGYLQSRFTLALDGVGHRGRTAGAIFITSAIFAVGHFVTIHHPQRLAVFFPSILFGLLRVRTKGIGSSVLFHALCNLFSEMLGKGFGVFA